MGMNWNKAKAMIAACIEGGDVTHLPQSGFVKLENANGVRVYVANPRKRDGEVATFDVAEVGFDGTIAGLAPPASCLDVGPGGAVSMRIKLDTPAGQAYLEHVLNALPGLEVESRPSKRGGSKKGVKIDVAAELLAAASAIASQRASHPVQEVGDEANEEAWGESIG